MTNFCPEWVFSSSAAAVAGGFLLGNAPIVVFANQFSNELNNHYNEIKPEVFEEAATKILEFLSEIEAGETAIDYINSYIYKRIKFHANNKPRKLTGIFVDEFSPQKIIDYSAEKAAILFRAFVFSSRSGLTINVPAGWEATDEDGIGWFGELMVSKPTIFDSL